MSIPVSVIVTTKNEEKRIAQCLKALRAFDDVWVVDSESTDKTQDVARQCGARVEEYVWDGQYPKKRQWCLNTLPMQYDYVFFVDADEVVSASLIDEIAALDWSKAGYFVQGLYEYDGHVLRHGLRNNKLALIDWRKIEFPVIDDLNIEGMGEIEGHYQPVLKAGYEQESLGQLCTPLIHQAYEDAQSWNARHRRYARWEAGMNAKNAWPKDPKPFRQVLKFLFRRLPFRGGVAFMHCYIFKLGFLDGAAGFRFACSRRAYYQMISSANKATGQGNATAIVASGQS